MKKTIRKNEKGITLIALVITVIVLIILAAISIMMISGNDGILARAGNAKEAVGQASVEEENKLESYESLIAKYTQPKEKLKIGDFVEYTYDEAEDYTYSSEKSGASYDMKQMTGLQWRIININESDSTVILASFASYQSTRDEFHFAKATGMSISKAIAQYEEAENILNDICKKHYSNKSLNINARSIEYEDYTEENKWVLMQAGSFFYATAMEMKNTYNSYSSYCLYVNSGSKIELRPLCYEDSYRNQTWGAYTYDYITPVVTIPISIIGEKINGVWKINQ